MTDRPAYAQLRKMVRMATADAWTAPSIVDERTQKLYDQLLTETDHETGLDRWRRRAEEAEAELAALKTVTIGYCPECGRGDCSPSAEQWYEQRRRADRAEAAITRVRALHVRNQPTGDCEHCSAGDYPNYSVPDPCPTIRTLDENQPNAQKDEPR